MPTADGLTFEELHDHEADLLLGDAPAVRSGQTRQTRRAALPSATAFDALGRIFEVFVFVR